MNKVNLYCFPFAGGSKYSYGGYIRAAPAFLNIVPVEIPGRGMRANEPLLTRLERIADDIFEQIKDQLNDQQYGLYGHSMGALLGYLVTKKIVQAQLRQPLHLFFTGCIAPSLTYRDLVDHSLPKAEFFERVKELGGSTDEIWSNEDLMTFFEPILRADFEAVASYRYTPSVPFSIPVSIVIGKEEKASYDEAMAWQKETTEPVEVKQLPGNHFFIFEHEQEILKMIAGKLHPSILQL
jgi:surfactin synthase thioesterase subunit